MVALTPEQIGDHHSALSEWQCPDQMIEKVEQIRCQIGAETFFNQCGLSFLREAWCAGRFAKERTASHVRIVHSDPPDFMIRIDGRDESFEMVEADIPGRKRGMEYRGLISENPESNCDKDIELEDYASEDWIKDKSYVEFAVRAVVSKKCRKMYPPDTSLLILLNISSFGLATPSEIEEVEATLRAGSVPARAKFQQVWAFWEGRSYHLT
jgi:hypothetical protein